MLMKPLKDTNYFVDDVLVILAYIKKQLSSILNNSQKKLYIKIKMSKKYNEIDNKIDEYTVKEKQV